MKEKTKDILFIVLKIFLAIVFIVAGAFLFTLAVCNVLLLKNIALTVFTFELFKDIFIPVLELFASVAIFSTAIIMLVY